MNSAGVSIQYLLPGLVKQQSAAEQLREQKQALYDRLAEKPDDEGQRKQLVKELQKVSSQLNSAELEEQNARLEAEHHRRNEEAARKKRKRDRELYGRHQENFIFSASLTKLISANEQKNVHSFLKSAYQPSGEPGVDPPEGRQRRETEKLNGTVAEARALALEEAREIRRHKRKIISELDRESATKRPRRRDYPEPLGWIDARYHRSRSRKVDISI